MKKIRLRTWVKVVLKIILTISSFMLLSECDDNLKLLIKNCICILISCISFCLLACYGGYNE